MLDLDPALRHAYSVYKSAENRHETVLARINNRRERLANMPAPLNFFINLAQAFGFEYEYPPKDLAMERQFTVLMQASRDIIGWLLAKTPGTYPLIGLQYHPNLRDEKLYPWVAGANFQIENDNFTFVVGSEQLLARSTKDHPWIQIRKGELPVVGLPRKSVIYLCTQKEAVCDNKLLNCFLLPWQVPKLTNQPVMITPPVPQTQTSYKP